MDLMEWASLTSLTMTWLIKTSSTSFPTPPQPRRFTLPDRTTITEEMEARSAIIIFFLSDLTCFQVNLKNMCLCRLFKCSVLPDRARVQIVWSPTRKLWTSCSSQWLWATLSPQPRRDHCPTGSGQPVLRPRTSAQSSWRCTVIQRNL